MKSPLLHAWTLRCIAFAFFLIGIWAFSTSMWMVGMFFMYCFALFSWLSGGEMRQHRRNLAEAEWERRRANGDLPPPLNPCCLRFRETAGREHAEDGCTGAYGLRQVQGMFEEIIAHYDDTPGGREPRRGA